MNNMKLRVCLTDKCNFKCSYCRDGGEAGIKTVNFLSKNQLVLLLKKMHSYGFESLRFTGGEPLLRIDWYEIIKNISREKLYNKITMVSNGSLLMHDNNIDRIKELGLKSITISLDSLDENTFYEITGRKNLKTVIEGIVKLKSQGINVKINSVIFKKNYSEVFQLIDFCNDNKINLKILDLVGMDCEYWKREYISLEAIEKELETISSGRFVQYQDEGFGTPEHVYKYKNIDIVIKNSSLGTCYIESCKKCNKFPCQSGVVSIILSQDGLLKLCSLNEDYFLDVKGLLNDDKKTREQLQYFIEMYNTAVFYQERWKGQKP